MLQAQLGMRPAIRKTGSNYTKANSKVKGQPEPELVRAMEVAAMFILSLAG